MSGVNVEEVAFGGGKYRALVELRNDVLRKPLGLAFTADDEASDRADFHIGAFEDGRAVGCVLLKPVDGATIKLRQMAVRETHQGRGIGARLVGFAEELAAARGFAVIEMHARKTARTFYEKLGYAVEGAEFVEVTVPHFKMHKRLKAV